ncbi:hypothetical protein [Angustibacter aerolatus]
MTTVIVGMLLALVLALGVVALVAVPARREGRELLSREGEERLSSARDRVVDLGSTVADKLPSASRGSRD